MLVLFETPAGYALFKVKKSGLMEADGKDVASQFATAESANDAVKLKAFRKFTSMPDALAAATALTEGKLSDGLTEFLQNSIVQKKLKDELAVYDSKLGKVIKKELNIPCIHSPAVSELMRGIRTQLNALIKDLQEGDMKAMSLGLAHSLSRYKLKFSPDKVDTMIVQAIALLDDLDKELNTYVMRVREWYGWHFPELSKLIADHKAFVRTIITAGNRKNFASTDFSEILPEEIEADVKEAAEISMGTEIADEDLDHIKYLAEQVLAIAEYRAQLYDYLKNRMNVIAPNLTLMVGELVGARLIAHAGSLLNLAKYPASTVQILGAEKALFRALKTKHDTPKYGHLYHASVVGQSSGKNKGKMSRVLAAKTSLVARIDALAEDSKQDYAMEYRAKVDARLRQLEGGRVYKLSKAGVSVGPSSYELNTPVKGYNDAADSTLGATENGEKSAKKDKKKSKEDGDDKKDKKKKKKEKKEKKDKGEKKKKDKGKRSAEDADADGEESPKKKKKSKKKAKLSE
ncbi:nucleolar protein 5 [Salpingoeca rosetta]|uniref:Nucleolar protein 58 n=1 Tax=Salpingoeca rosetta (strain ATCC 50818 / BSB-021) TaxID=946362 RepID=F2UL16_SALR5|nr:nucleolar protein 5 [Salpingoeca rosetta]EGD77815.1 nucleolar protein 5 [Salpingoeca rosetta]|eukprot:XP_004990291.1 nucleolar protein 5 [Salpingoeca rosetta]